MSSQLFFLPVFCTSIFLTLATPLLGVPMERVDPKTTSEYQQQLTVAIATETCRRGEEQEAVQVDGAARGTTLSAVDKGSASPTPIAADSLLDPQLPNEEDKTWPSSGLSTFNAMDNIRENQNPISDTLPTDMAATAATAETALAGRFNGHDIRTIAPNIDNMTEVIGVHPQLVRDWVSAGLRNNTTAQEETLHQIVQIIKRRTVTMSDNDLADLKNDLANRALEAQGRPIVPKKEASSTTLAGDDLRRLQVPEESPTTADDKASSTRHDVPTSTAGFFDALQKSGLGHLAPDFLVGDAAKQKKEYEQKYAEALNDLRTFSLEIADAMEQEPLPKTEEEAQAFKTKYEGLMQASASGDAESLARLKERFTRVYGLKAALKVLDAATEHRTCFLKALQNSADPRMDRFYYEKIGSIDKTVQNLQRAAASILQTTENIITNDSRWREAVEVVHRGWLLDQRFNNANRHAAESIRLNIQYAEAIRVGDPQAARDLAQEAQRHARQSELLYSGVDSEIRGISAAIMTLGYQWQWHIIAIAFFQAAEATEAGNQSLADIYIKAATYHRNSIEARPDNNDSLPELFTQAVTYRRDAIKTSPDLAIRWASAGYASLEAADATKAGKQVVATLLTQEATCYKNAAEATRVDNEPLAEQWDSAGYASLQVAAATEAGNQPVADLYTQLATYRRNAIEAKLADDEPRAEQWDRAANRFLLVAAAATADYGPVANLYIQQGATCYKNAVAATLDDNEPRAEQWDNAAAAFLKAARAAADGRHEDSYRLKEEADAIAGSIGRTWGEWIAQTFLPG